MAKASKWHGRVEGASSDCAHPGCAAQGEYKAPLAPGGRDGPGRWRLLCLDHVRAHNAAYNYFAGMSPEEIAREQSPIPGWERSTRAFAAAASGADPGPAWQDFADPLDAIAARFARGAAPRAAERFSGAERHALHVLGLADDCDRTALRRRYALLLRRYHPDRNGGDRSHEKKLADVIAAYQQLKGARAFA